MWLPALAVALGLLGVAAAGMAMPVVVALAGPAPAVRTFPSDSVITDRAGNVIADIHPSGISRIPDGLNAISPDFQAAIVATEDRGFWTEGALDPARVLSAAWDDLRQGSSAQGASTIAMQLAKLLYLQDNRSLIYKVKEIAYASDLMKTMSHAQVLDAYLNDLPFGSSATGIEAAARTYFGVPAAKLDLAESAVLAGLPQAPGADDPLVNPAAARSRQLEVLAAMERDGAITATQGNAAAAEPLHYADGQADNVDLYPAFVARVVGEVGAKLHTDVATAGLQISSTLDPRLQQLAQSTVSQQVSQLGALNVTDGALVSMDPQTGQVVAYVGNAGPNVPGADYDMASFPRQMGSSVKLFNYPTALAARQMSMLTPVLDGPITVPLSNGTTYQPNDYDHKWHGVLPIALALGNSLNVPAVRVELLGGIPNVIATARRMGVTTLTKPASTYGPSLTLGSYPVPLWEMAQAATAYAGGGTMRTAEFATKVTDAAGHVLYQAPAGGNPKQVMDPGVAFIMNQILSNDANRVMEFGSHSDLTLDGHVVSAKTGTSQDFRDNVTIGWTPSLVTATWVGNANDSPMRGTTGITGAAPIWHGFMTAALNGVADSWPGPPPDVTQETVSGADVGSIDGMTGWFLTGTDWSTGAAQLTGMQGLSGSDGTTNVSYQGNCRYWTYQNGNYWYCGNGMSNLPGDPGPQGSTSAPPPGPGPGGGGPGGGGPPGHQHH